MPDLNLQFGKLQYKYWSTTDNYYSKFSQLNDIKPNKYDNNGNLIERGLISFNSFMHEPEFVNVNHINYKNDILEYIKLNNIKYIDNTNEELNLENFNKYILIENSQNNDSCKIYLHKDVSLNLKEVNNIYLHSQYINLPSLRYISNDLIFGEIYDNQFKIIENINEHLITVIEWYFIFTENNFDHYIILEELNKRKHKYNENIDISLFELETMISRNRYPKNIKGIIDLYNDYFNIYNKQQNCIDLNTFAENIKNIRKIEKINNSFNQKTLYKLFDFLYIKETYSIYKNDLCVLKVWLHPYY